MDRVGNTNQISLAQIQNMDVETALMAVQSNRASLLEQQLTQQISEVQKRNNKISALNELLGSLNNVASQFKGDAKADAVVDGGVPKAAERCTEVRNAAKAAGIDDLGMLPEGQSISVHPNGFGGPTTKGAIDGKIAQVKAMIDSQSNSSQMDMLRLQSLTNKRNEAYDLMSTFMKKCSDGRASIMSNMR